MHSPQLAFYICLLLPFPLALAAAKMPLLSLAFLSSCFLCFDSCRFPCLFFTGPSFLFCLFLLLDYLPFPFIYDSSFPISFVFPFLRWSHLTLLISRHLHFFNYLSSFSSPFPFPLLVRVGSLEGPWQALDPYDDRVYCGRQSKVAIVAIFPCSSFRSDSIIRQASTPSLA